MKGKRFLAGILATAMVATSFPVTTRASLLDDDVVQLEEVEQTETVEDDSGGKVYESGEDSEDYGTNWDKLKDEISNAISAISLDDDEEPVEEESVTRAASSDEFYQDGRYGGDKVNTSMFDGIGKYQLNWTGNSNYQTSMYGGEQSALQYIERLGTKEGLRVYKEHVAMSYKYHTNTASAKRKSAAKKALGVKIYNSSSAKMSKGEGATSIKKAFLMWQTRAGHEGDWYYTKKAYGNEANTVALVRPDGTAMEVTATKKHTFSDLRPGGTGGHLSKDGTELEDDGVTISCLYNYYADVTSFVKGDKKGSYGEYTVCNIRPWEPDGHGGGCGCQWQLIFVENCSDSDKVSAITLDVGSYCRDFPNQAAIDRGDTVALSKTLELPAGLSFKGKSKLNLISGYQGSIEGKITLDFSPDDAGISTTETIHGRPKEYEDKLYSGGERNRQAIWDDGDKRINNYLDATFNLRKATVDVESASRDVTVNYHKTEQHWSTYYLAGAMISFDFPFSGNQKTEVNQTTGAVTVSNTITNKVTDGNKKLGIYSGKVVVELDKKLTVNTKADGSWNVTHSAGSVVVDNNAHTVTFSGVDLKTNGKTFSYSINCTAAQPGGYNNSDEYSGKLWNGNAEKDKRETNTEMGVVYSGSSKGKWDIVPVKIKYHLNAPNGEAYDAGNWGENPEEEYRDGAGVPYNMGYKNDPNTKKYDYSILDPDDLGFNANNGYMFAMEDVPGGATGGLFWTDAAGNRYRPGDTIYPTGDMDLYAHWMPDHYDVIYVANGGTGRKLDNIGFELPLYNGQENTGVDRGGVDDFYECLSSDKFVRDGWYFTGWNTRADYRGGHWEPGEEFYRGYSSSPLFLYAQWEPVGQYEVQFVDGYQLCEGKSMPTYDTAEFYNSFSPGKEVTVDGTTVKCLKRDSYEWMQRWNLPSVEDVVGQDTVNKMKEQGYSFAGWGTEVEVQQYYNSFGSMTHSAENLVGTLEKFLKEFNRAYSEALSADYKDPSIIRYDGTINIGRLQQACWDIWGQCRTLKECIEVYNRIYKKLAYTNVDIDSCCIPYGHSYYTKPDGTKVVTLSALWVKTVDSEILYLPYLKSDDRDTGGRPESGDESETDDFSDKLAGTMDIQTAPRKSTIQLAKNRFMRSKHRYTNWKMAWGDTRTFEEGLPFRIEDGITIMVADWAVDTEPEDDKVFFISYGSSKDIPVERERHEEVQRLNFSGSGSGTSGSSSGSGNDGSGVISGPGSGSSSSGSGSSGTSDLGSATTSQASNPIIFPQAYTIAGWKFDGWVEREYAEQYWKDNYVGITEVYDSSSESSGSSSSSSSKPGSLGSSSSSSSKPGSSGSSSTTTTPVWNSKKMNGKLFPAGTKMRFKTGTVFYAQYSKGNYVYFVQQNGVETKGIEVCRGSFRINLYESAGTVTAPKQIVKTGWTAAGWTRNADCMATAECNDGDVVTINGGDVYYGLYQKSVTVGYDANSYDPVAAMPSAQTKTAYYTTAGWDRSQESNYANCARQYVVNNVWLNKWFTTTPGATDNRKTTDRGYQFPTFSIANFVSVYRKINEKETDVVPYIWSTETKGSTDNTKQSTGWLENYTVYLNCYPGNTIEFREDTTLYQIYKVLGLSDGDLIHTSVSILAGDSIKVDKSFETDKISDTGRVYVSDDRDVAKTTQDGKITGVSDGTTVIHVYASDGKTPVGECTVYVSTCAVSVPQRLPVGSYANVGVTVRTSGNASVTGNLYLEALSGLEGIKYGQIYKLVGYKRANSKSKYQALKQGDLVTTVTASGGKKETNKVQFKIEPLIAYEELYPDYYTGEIAWRLELYQN